MLSDTKEIVFGDVFNVSAPNNIVIINQTEDGTYPLVSRSSYRNGICKYIAKYKGYDLEPGRCLTVACSTQEVFYQENPFYSTQNVLIVRHKNLNLYNGCYIINILKQYLKFRFDWSYGVSIDRLKKLKIPIPVAPNGDLDWNYMERVSRDLFIKEYRQRLEKGEKSLMSIGKVRELHEPHHYGSVNFKTLFPEVKRGKSLIRKYDRIPGTIPYVSATQINNGVDCYLSNPNNLPTYKDCLTMSIVGGSKSTFYHEEDFLASPNVLILKNKLFNKYIYLYLIGWLNAIGELHSYGYTIAPYRLEHRDVDLPMTADNEIDFDYMETYVKNLMIKEFEKKINICKFKLEELHG